MSAVVGVVTLVAIFGAATLSVDAGNVWQTRRNMITATDAGALGEAGALAFSNSSVCTGLYDSVLTNNAGADVYERVCTVVRFADDGTGYVSVEGRKPIDVRFGSVLGLGDTNAYSLSAAMFGFATAARGLRPIGICNENSHVLEWRDLKSGAISQAAFDALKGNGDENGDGLIDHPVAPGAGARPAGRTYGAFGVVHRIYFNHDQDDGACGTFPGNVGWLSFDGLPADIGDRADWLWNGYDGEVSIRLDTQPPCPGFPGSGDADDSAEGCVPADSGGAGNSNPVMQALDSILDDPIYILIFDAGACSGGGVTCTIESWAFLGVILRGYKLTGAQEARFFDFEFTNIQVSGVCCDPGPGNEDLGARAVALCAVDHDSEAISASNRCGAVQN